MVLGNKGKKLKGTREHEPILGNRGTRTTGGELRPGVGGKHICKTEQISVGRTNLEREQGHPWETGIYRKGGDPELFSFLVIHRFFCRRQIVMITESVVLC